MAFIQIVEFKTDDIDGINALWDSWEADTEGTRTASRAYQCSDRDNPGTYCQVVVFDSYEDAMKNSELPETQEAAGKMAELVGGQISFRNLDVIRENEA